MMKNKYVLQAGLTASVFMGAGCTGLDLQEEDLAASAAELVDPDYPCAVDGASPESRYPCPGYCGDLICDFGEELDCPEDCDAPPPYIRWSNWLDRDYPSGSGDWETLADFATSQVGCTLPAYIEAQTSSGVSWRDTGQVLTVSPNVGLICRNADQGSGYCLDYKVKFGCVTPDWLALPRAWHEDHDRRDGNIEYFVPTSVSLPVARFRAAMTFQPNGAFEILRLAPNDAHYLAYGTWTRSDDIITVDYYDSRTATQIQERYQVAELISDVFRFRRL